MVDAYNRLGISGLWRNAIAHLDWWKLFGFTHHQDLTVALERRSTGPVSTASITRSAGLARSIVAPSGPWLRRSPGDLATDMDARSSGLHTHRVRAASRGTEAKVTGVPGCVLDGPLGRTVMWAG